MRSFLIAHKLLLEVILKKLMIIILWHGFKIALIQHGDQIF